MDLFPVFSCLKPPVCRLAVPLVLLSLVAQGLKAEEYLDSTKQTLAIQVQHAIYNDDFALADSIGQVLIDKYAEDPIGPFSRSAALLGRMFDREEAEPRDSLLALLDIADSLAGCIRDTCSNATAAWMSFFRGHVRSYRAMYESRFGSKLKALRLGFDILSEYEKGREFDSSCYDLYLGLGLYHYWKSSKGGILRKVRILKNEMQRGIDELRLAADSSRISREAARNSLIWIWLDQKEYDSALTLSLRMSEQFPDGKLFLWPAAQAYFKKKQFSKAAGIYNRLRQRLEADPGNYYNLIECDYQLYRCYEEPGDTVSMKSLLERFRGYREQIPDDTSRRQRDKLKYLIQAARSRYPSD